MQEVDHVTIQDSGEKGYFKDEVARADIAETKRMVEEIDNAEITTKEVENIYNRLHREIFG